MVNISYSKNIKHPNYYLTKSSFFQLFSLLIVLFYVIFLPKGFHGLFLSIGLLLFAFNGVNKQTLGVYFILFGPVTLGIVLQSFGIYQLGSFISIFIGFLLISFSQKEFKYNIYWKLPIVWLLIIIAVITFSYFIGPQTEYSQHKYVTFIYKLIILVFTLVFLIRNRRINMWQLGTLGIISGVLYIASVFYAYNVTESLSIFTLGDFRNYFHLTEAIGRTNTIAISISMGMIFILSDLAKFKKNNLVTFLPLLVGFILLSFIGQRLYILIPVLVTPILLFCKPNSKSSIKALTVILITLLIVIVIFSVSTDNELITAMFEPEQSFSSRLNREINWDSAFTRIKEKPLLGHGLGGYFVDGYSLPGQGTYAHNLFMELLTETGIIGTTIILLPVIFLFIKPFGKKIFIFRTANEGVIMTLVLFSFFSSMVSHDLTQSVLLFATVASIWAVIPSVEY